VLKSSDVLEILVPILYHLNDSRADQCKWNSVFWVCVLSFLELAGISIFNNGYYQSTGMYICGGSRHLLGDSSQSVRQ